MPDLENQDLVGSHLSLLSPQDAVFDSHKAIASEVSHLYGQDVGPAGFSVGLKGKLVQFGNYSVKIHSCGYLLKFVRGDGEKLKLVDAKFCKVPFCPMCQWRRALKWRAKFLTLLPGLQEKFPTYRWLFLTLTIKNCDLQDLKSTIKHLNQSFKRLSELKAFPMVGSIKSLEVTRAWDCFDSFTGEYLGTHGTKWVYQYNQKFPNDPLQLQPTTEVHPHLHIVGLVKPSYFSHGYISQEKWVQLWKQSLRVDYDPILDIRVVKSKKSDKLPTPEQFEVNPDSDKTGMVKAICEVVKYTVKKSDLVGIGDPDHDHDNVLFLKALTEQLYKTRRIEYRGILKELAKELESAYNDDDLILVNEDVEKDDTNYQELTFKWYQALEKYILFNDNNS